MYLFVIETLSEVDMEQKYIDLKSLIRKIVYNLVDYPDEVIIREAQGESTIIYELRVHQKDIGKVLGKKGKIVQSIRTILAGASGKIGKRVILDVIE